MSKEVGLDVFFTKEGRLMKCKICHGEIVTTRNHLNQLHPDVVTLFKVTPEKALSRIIIDARTAWQSDTSPSIFDISPVFEKNGSIFFKCIACGEAGVKRPLSHLGKRHLHKLSIDDGAMMCGGIRLERKEVRDATLHSFWNTPKTEKPLPVKLKSVKREPVDRDDVMAEPEVISLDAEEMDYVEVIEKDPVKPISPVIIHGGLKLGRPVKRLSGPSLEEITKKLIEKPAIRAKKRGYSSISFLARNVAKGKKRREDARKLLEKEREGMRTPDELCVSILDRDEPINFTQFLCASDPLRGYYTLYNMDKLDTEKCTSPDQIFEAIQQFSEGELVEDCMSNPPAGGVRGLETIKYTDLNEHGYLTLLRWAGHVEVKDGGYESGERRDAIVVWNQTVVAMKRQLFGWQTRTRR